MLSIGKLAYFAQTQDSNVRLDETALDGKFSLPHLLCSSAASDWLFISFP
jgi:hypothetical protein